MGREPGRSRSPGSVLPVFSSFLPPSQSCVNPLPCQYDTTKMLRFGADQVEISQDAPGVGCESVRGQGDQHGVTMHGLPNVKHHEPAEPSKYHPDAQVRAVPAS